MFNSIFNSQATTSIGVKEFTICIVAALIVGLSIALAYTYKNKYTKSFVVTLALLPAIVASIIIMVNGNLGAGVAVAGTFSLVRFRSAPGSAKEICSIFLAMAVGLAMGMGLIGYGVLLAVIICAANVLYNVIPFGEAKPDLSKKVLKITIPEELDYTEIFNDLFDVYTKEANLMQVKTANMGSMFKLTYDITLSNVSKEKEFIDSLRCRNGNLEVVCSRGDLYNNDL